MDKKRPPTLGLKAKGTTQWFKGRLCPIRKENAWFIKPMTELPEGYATTRDVFMYPNYISQHVLPVAEGDMLEFILGDRDKTKPMAQKVRVSQYRPRTCKELIEYIRKLTEDLNSVNVKKVLVQVLPCTAMWRFLGSPVFKGVPDEEYTSMTYVELLLTLLKLVLHHGKSYKTLLEDVIKTVTRGTIFQATNDRSLPAIIESCNYGDNDRFYSEEQETFLSAELLRSCCHDAIRQVPSVTRCLLPTVTAISKKISNPSTPSFLCALLWLNSSGENGFIANASIWIELPLIPTDHELAGHLVEKDKHLTRVRTHIPYDNPEQYMDTYFRLIRAETFSAMQHGIKDLKASALDLRDMNVYYNIHLAGFELQSGRFSLAIHFTPTKKVKKWEASPQLMYGNLVCVSINRKFDDVVWATVTNRDADLLNKHQIIMLELLDENVKSISEIINSLQTQGGSGVMVESPTYYHSLSPVLRRLKEFDMENFPLQAEVIYAKPSLELPGYLKEATFHTSIVCSSKKTARTADESQKDKSEEGKDSSNTLDASEGEDIEEAEVLDAQSLGSSCEIDSDRMLMFCSDSSSDVEINAECSLEAKSNLSLESRSKSIKRSEINITMSRRSSSSDSATEFMDILPDFWPEEKMNAKPACEKDYINPDNSICLLLGNCCIDPSEIEATLHSDGERMDTDPILRNTLQSTTSSKADRSDDIKESTSITTLSVDSSTASISSEPRDKSSQERLGRRMNVERFLEIFNSSSKSSLEASQCEALVHALKNRLAIIQGPPGCGKTFIGVKIVQLLLSLSPKLEKPILLLTYKNHALDEFLKHMLQFCRVDDLVRIGGRSKEPKLESCNLKNIQNCISYEKATRAEIQNTRTEIADIESKIKKISSEVEASSYLTQRSLVDELTEEQIQSLIVEAGWGSGPMIYRLGRRNIADKTWMKMMLNDVVQNYGSVKEFLQASFETRVSNNNHLGISCINAFLQAFQHWFPDRKELQRMKEFQAEFILQIQSDTTADEDASKESEDGEDDDSGDEDYVKQLLETRMAAGTRQGVRSDDLILFDPTKTKNRNDILVNISDYPPDMVVSSQIRSVNNLWSLNEVQRLQLLYCILNEKTSSVSQELNDLIDQVQSLRSRREELETNDKVEMLSQKKIIGVTITGASINHDLIHHIGPSIVIVEEAAEILEPSLLAALTPSIEHLILIGDHKQLRPQVDTYELCKNFQLDISMMERLIESGLPFKSLAKQNRMRPEFSALLHDIYPNLEDNLPLVSKNEPLKCIAKSMFFWSHDDPEKKDRTYTNVKEAERIIALVMYLLCNGVRPSDITVLAAYLGQTKLLRNMIKQEKANKPKFFEEIDNSGEEREGFVQVQTIDMYQGDENKYVIVSLVRSNEENRIGFLNRMNRRCVAQSRAKCGMYFVGNLNTLCGAKDSCWSAFIASMMRQDCVGNEFPLQCIKHESSKYKALDGNMIRQVNAKPTLLCKQLCGDPYPYCDKHPCKKPCFPRHHHTVCPELVDDQFPDCGHDVKRRCPKKISDLRCQVIATVDLPCGHEGAKKCSQNVSDVICKIPVTATFERCGHKTEKECYVKIEKITCQHICKEMNSCGIHQCKDVCGNSHGHDCCPEKVDYNFPNCGHPSLKQKKCFEEITGNCTSKVLFTGVCGHEIQKECHQSESEVKCPIKPCGRERKCGHPCTNACGDDCEKGECKHCQRVYHKKMEEFREAARKRVKELEDKIKKKEIPNFSRDEIRGSGATAAEYQKVKDQVLKFIQPMHNWFPKVTKIEKVTNLDLEKKFEAAKAKAFGDYIDTKFHGTSNNALRNIIKKGFRMPDQNPPPPKRGMYGQGIYFATDSSKSAQKIYTQGSQKLLLCQVILGKSKEVRKADYSLNKKQLRSNNFDSVYAPRGSAVKNDEFVIFDPDQALPQYIIHFSDLPPSPSSLIQKTFTVKKVVPSRTVDIQDQFQMYYSWAEAHFRRMAAKSHLQQVTISSIDIVINKDLEDKFEATKQKFQSQGIPDKEILAYHGTDKKNIDSILKSNLQLSYAKRQAYGKGNYFSEFPAVSLGYGDGLLLCRILPGKEYVNSTNCDIPQDYNSKKVLRSQSARAAGASAATAANASGDIIIIENSDQILPFFVIHR